MGPGENIAGRVHNHKMKQATGFVWVMLAGCLSSVPICAQTISNQSLTGKYYFRQVSLGTDGVNPGGLTDPRSLMGTITFDPVSGRYSFTAQQLTGTTAAVSQTGSGVYSVDSGGF